MSETNNEATRTDESSVNDFDFDALADEVLGLEPDEATQEDDEATEELEGEDHNTDEDADEVDDAEDDEAEEEEEDEDESEDATQKDSDLETGDEIDMEFKVPVKIDGKESEVSMDELVASYQTKQSQSKKGDEIAEQAKSLAQAKEEAVMFANINAELLKGEDTKDQQVLKGLSDRVDKAFDDNNPDANKLNRQLDKAKEEYKTRQTNRNSVVDSMSQKIQEQRQEQFGQQVEAFNSEIKNHVSDWSEEVALKNRDFALGLGLNEQFVDTITDPVVVKVIDEYRRLKEISEKGQVKRKKASVKRVPTKKASSVKTKKSNKIEEARNRSKKGRATEKDSQLLFDDVIDNIFSG
jgi:chemotaxis protein histidine kinase CheA